MVLKNIEFYGSKTQSLLPSSVVACIKEFGVGDPQFKLTEEVEIAFTQWRAVTAHILSKCQKDQHFETGQKKDRVGRLVDIINDTVGKFHDSERDNTERLQNLRGIVSKAAVVGDMIFASPSRWKFDWNPSSRDLRDRYRHNKHGKPLESYQARDKEVNVVILVQLPALVQKHTQDLSNTHAYTTRVPGDYDEGSAASDILKEVRRFSRATTAADDPPEIVHPVASGSHLSISSKSKSERRQSKLLED